MFPVYIFHMPYIWADTTIWTEKRTDGIQATAIGIDDGISNGGHRASKRDPRAQPPDNPFWEREFFWWPGLYILMQNEPPIIPFPGFLVPCVKTHIHQETLPVALRCVLACLGSRMKVYRGVWNMIVFWSVKLCCCLPGWWFQSFSAQVHSGNIHDKQEIEGSVWI